MSTAGRASGILLSLWPGCEPWSAWSIALGTITAGLDLPHAPILAERICKEALGWLIRLGS